MKKLFVIFTLAFCGFMFFLPVQICLATDAYKTLSPITSPGGTKMESVNTSDFPSYLNAVYRIGIGVCFVLGVIMFTWAGIEYIVSESMNTKSAAKKRINGALIGLAIALVSYILLQTINPDLPKFKDLKVTPAASAISVRGTA